MQFVEYKKMIYLDGDIQVYQNIDHLFEEEDGHFYAVMDCFCEKTWSHSPQYQIGYCQQCPDRVKWPPASGSPPPLYFNAGMFVFEPSLETYKSLLETLHVTAPTPFAEQDFLNMFFGKVYKPISATYNLVLAMLWRHPENVPDVHNVKVVHYCAAVSLSFSNFLSFFYLLITSEFPFSYLFMKTGIQTMEVYRARSKHGKRRHQNVGVKMVGHLQRHFARFEGSG